MTLLLILDENDYHVVAGVTGLEPATSCVTGRRSNQLSYTPKWWAVRTRTYDPLGVNEMLYQLS